MFQYMCTHNVLLLPVLVVGLEPRGDLEEDNAETVDVDWRAQVPTGRLWRHVGRRPPDVHRHRLVLGRVPQQTEVGDLQAAKEGRGKL